MYYNKRKWVLSFILTYSSRLLPFCVAEVLLSPLLPIFISDYWLRTVVILSFFAALLNYFVALDVSSDV